MDCATVQMETVREDRLRRFTPAPHAADFRMMGRTLRLETNNVALLRAAQKLFGTYEGPSSTRRDFTWRLITEAHTDSWTPWSPPQGLSDAGLGAMSWGPGCFAAIDHHAREVVGFFPDALVADEDDFAARFLAPLFERVAGILALTPIHAACVGLAGKAAR